jgi:hypothetical protein
MLNTITTPAPPLTFPYWLAEQEGRSDEVGLFARIARGWSPSSYSGYLLRLVSGDAGHAAQRGLVQAHDEWKRYSGNGWAAIRSREDGDRSGWWLT